MHKQFNFNVFFANQSARVSPSKTAQVTKALSGFQAFSSFHGVVLLDGDVISSPPNPSQIDQLTMDNTKLNRQVTEQNQIIRMNELKVKTLESRVEELIKEKNQLTNQLQAKKMEERIKEQTVGLCEYDK